MFSIVAKASSTQHLTTVIVLTIGVIAAVTVIKWLSKDKNKRR